MHTRSLFRQLFLTTLLVAVLGATGTTIYAVTILRAEFYKQIEATQRVTAQRLRGSLRELILSARRTDLQAKCKEIGDLTGIRITVILPGGEVIADSSRDSQELGDFSEQPEVREALAGDAGLARRYSSSAGHDLIYVALPVLRNGNVAAALRCSRGVPALEESILGVRWHLLAALIVAALLAAIVCAILARRTTAPYEELRQGAEHLAAGELGYRIPRPDAREATALAGTLNRMAEQLEERVRVLLEERNEREALLSSMSEGVLAVDRDERVITLNPSARRILGIETRDVHGRTLAEIVRNPILQRLVRNSLTGKPEREEELDLDGGTSRRLQARAAVLRGRDGRALGALVVLTDVTRLRRLETVRRDFVANVSHELRTPITSIQGFLETLRDGALHDPDAATRFLDIAIQQTLRLNAIIEDLLSLSRIEAEDKARLALTSSPLRSVLETVRRDLAGVAEDQRVSLEIDCDRRVSVRMNRPLLRQAIENLVQNAIKYSDPGGSVEIIAEEGPDDVRVLVRDHGCGIEAQHLPRLFERFYRVDRERSRSLGGTGLGLSIVKHVAQAHGGSVDVQSVPGEGSTFTIALPR